MSRFRAAASPIRLRCSPEISKQRRVTYVENFRVIDADAHMHEPQHLWERYVEAGTGTEFPKSPLCTYFYGL